ncbi:MAG: DEAD/DEAH box helicase [Acidobacteria bacterium]|nr:DEAD/DEAH box helicase [Acidobacteriota bacterium]
MNALPSTADVEAGMIIVRASIADLMTCCRMPNAKWDSARKAWSFPATPATAALLRKRLRGVAESDRFKLILATSVTIKLDREQAVAPAAGEGIPGNVIPLTPPVPDALPVPAPDVTPLPAPQEPEVVVELPAGLRTEPWRHQRAAYKFCLDHFAQGLCGLLLAMGMGTGKTLVAFLLLLGLAARRVLICCPLRVVPVWVTQFGRHVAIDLVVVPLDTDAGSVADKMELAEEKLRLAEARGVPFVAVINYDSAWRDPFATWAEKQRWDLVIADEAHRIKAPGGKASMFSKRLRTKALHRVLLTGTPMPHGPMDIFAPMRFADIRIFGPSFAAFRQKYAVMGGYLRKQITGFQKLDELERLMSRVTYRVGKEVLDLPPETDVTYHCDLGGEARRIYKDIEEDFVAQVRDGMVTAANAMVKLVRLQQVANGIAKTDDGVEQRIDDSKQKLLADTLEDIGGGEPVVVFCRFHADLDAIHESCRALQAGLTEEDKAKGHYRTLELSGRRDELQQWQEGAAQVLAVQLDSGGEGVDFTRARYSVFYSLGFSLGKYEQARSRTHRPGQTSPVEHIHLIARNTVDVKIMRALEKRAEVIESILAEITS